MNTMHLAVYWSRYYDTVTMDADDFDGQEVVVLGRGNAALEVAQHIYGHTSRVHLMARTRIKLSWETHCKLIDDEDRLYKSFTFVPLAYYR